MEQSKTGDLTRMLQELLEQQLQKNINLHHGLLHQLYQQLEAFITITSLLDIRHPLPPMRGWAASPDFLVLVLGEILSRKPDLVVELGSGVSTLVSAYALQKVGTGRMISIDHDSGFLDHTRRQLATHELSQHVETIFAPLTKIALNGVEWKWYDLSSATIPDSIDILVVDGPPGNIQARSRYPALPILVEHLKPDTVVFLDDAARPDEQAIAREWALRYPGFSHELAHCEKGAAVFRRSAAS